MPEDVLNMLILNTLPHAMWTLDLVTLYDIDDPEFPPFMLNAFAYVLFLKVCPPGLTSTYFERFLKQL